MHHLLPSDLATALGDISTARLSSYQNFFSPANDAELYGLYCWNDAISSRYMRLLGILEIILRNRFHTTLSQYAWNPSSSLGTEHSNDWYMKLYTPFASGSSSTSDRNLKKKIGSMAAPASPNKVIAGMTYGFWPHVLDKLNDNSGVAVPWGTLIPTILPNHHQRDATYWGVLAHQDALFARIELVGELRNRVAHFEPLWKFGAEMSETRDRPHHPRTVVAPAPVTVPDALKRLQRSYRKTTQLLHWLSKARAAEYSESENHQSLQWLMTEDGLKHFRTLPKHQKVRLGSLTKAWGLKSELQSTKFAVITYKKKAIGRYYSEPC
jgi:hypothetical protein